MDPERIIENDLSNPYCEKTPEFLQQVDYCDTMMGLTLHTELVWHESGYAITVEPFLDEKKKILGAIGMIRLIKRITENSHSAKLPFPTARDHTQPIDNPRALSLSGETLEEKISRIRSSIRPRRLSPVDS